MGTHGRVVGTLTSGWSVGGKLIWTFFGVLCLFLVLLQAHATRYVYDGNGRLVAVTREDGTSARYTYDAMGNLIEIGTEPAGKLRLFAFTPTHGSPGTPVTVYGQGFDGGAPSVSFNGTAGSVLSTTVGELHTVVPDGATTGPIAVIAGGQTAVSTNSFVVDDTGLAPQITGIAPTVAVVGDAISVSGSHLHPATGVSTVKLGSNVVAPTSATNESIQFTVPPGIGGGKVMVSTPYGHAASTEDLVVVPSSVGASNIVASARLAVDGAGANLSINVAGKYGALLFDADVGSWLSLQFDQVTTTATNVSYTVYDPLGRATVSGNMDPAVPTIHLPQANVAGTYTVLLTPGSASAQFQVRVESSLRATADGSDLLAVTAGAGQSRRMFFTARDGDNLEIGLSKVVVSGGTPYNEWVRITVYDQIGRPMTSLPSGSADSLHLWGLSKGTYTAILSPGSASSGRLRIQGTTITLTRNVIGPSLEYGTPVTVALSRQGQAERMTFTANAGDPVLLAVNTVSTVPSGNAVYFAIYQPDGTQLTSVNTNGPAVWNLDNLPQAGTYTVVTWGASGYPNTTQVTLSKGVVDALEIDGPSKSYATSFAGQNVYLNFNANAGDNLEFALSDVVVAGGSPYNDWVRVGVYDQAGRLVANLGAGSADSVHLWGLAAGAYRAVITPGNSPNGALQIKNVTATLTRNVVGQLVYGTQTTVALSRPGQAARLTFTANAGDAVFLMANAVATTPAGNTVYFVVYQPDGSQLTNFNTKSPASWNLDNFSQSGTYTLVTWGGSGYPNTTQLTLLKGVMDTLAVDGASTTYTAPVAGQNVYLNFNANAGDNLEFAVSDVAVTGGTPYNDWVRVGIYDSNGRLIENFGSGSINNAHLWGLASGTYRIVITPGSAASGPLRIQSLTATLTRDVTGSLMPYGTATAVSLPHPGQTARLTFTANAGDTATLVANAITTTPAGNTVYFTIYRPDGSRMAGFSATDSASLDLPALTQDGTYTVVVSVVYGLPASMQLMLKMPAGS
jgi:YD repeat-containing protein